MEVLIVLAIVGVMAGAAVLSIGASDHESQANTEAQRLANRLRMAADEALVTGHSLTFRWDNKGYAFFVRGGTDDQWHAYSDTILGRHELSGDIHLLGPSESKTISIGPDGVDSQVVIEVAGASGGWSVLFDGFNVAISASRVF